MAENLKLTCLECGSVHRVPVAKVGAGPKCGTCGARLNDTKVTALDPAVLQKAAKNDDLPLLVDFWAPWCGPCRAMAPQFMQAAQALGAQARLAKIDTQEYQKVSQRYGIRGIPALILFQNGRELARLDGARPSGQIVDFVRKKSKLIA